MQAGCALLYKEGVQVVNKKHTDYDVDMIYRQNQLKSTMMSVLNDHLPVEGIVKQMGEALMAEIPADRFSLGLPLMDRWYFWEDGKFTSESGALSLLLKNQDFSGSCWVLVNKKPLLRKNIAEERRFQHDAHVVEGGMLSDLIIPLVINHEAVGTFNLTSRKSDSFDQTHLQIAESVVDILAVAIRQLQFQEQTETIQAISQAVQSSLDLDDILKMVIEHIHSKEGYDRVRVYTYDSNQEAMIGAVEIGLGSDRPFHEIVYPLKSDIFTQQTLAANSPCIYQTNTQELKALDKQRKIVGILTSKLLDRVEYREWCEIPLKVAENDQEIIVGKIALDNALSHRPLIKARLNYLMVYASQTAIAIRHAQMYQQVATQAEVLSSEAQERVEKQEVLLNVNEAVQAMREPKNIETVLLTIFGGLRELSINCQVLALHRPLKIERKLFETVALMPDGDSEQIKYFQSQQPIVFDIFQTQGTTYYPRTDLNYGKRTKVHLEHTLEHAGVQVFSTLDVVSDRSLLVFMSEDKDAFTKPQIQFMEEINQVLAVGLARLEDMEAARARNRSQAGLLEIGRAIQEMAYAEDLESLVRMLYDRLQEYGLNFVGVQIYRIVDEVAQSIVSYHRLPNGDFSIRRGINPGVTSDWKNNKIIHRPNTDHDLQGLPEGYVDRMYSAFNIRVRSMLNVPYSRGELVLRSDEPDAFSEEDIQFVEQIADMLSIAITRVEDLEQLEAQNQVLKENEKKIQTQFQELESVYRHTPVGLFMMDRDFRLLRFNDRLAEINDLKETDVGCSLLDIIPDQIEERRQLFDRLLETGEPVRDLEVRGYTPKEPDVLRTWLANYYPLRSENGEVDRILGAVVDITDQKQMEEEHMQTERLRALGEMAAGVSHNLNNILTGILGPAQLLQVSLDDEEILGDVEAIIASGLRARDIVKQLNRGLRNDRESLESVDVNAVATEAIRVARPRWKDEAEARGITVEVVTAFANVPHIQGTETGLHDILVNLLFNAVDAMPEGGTITIGTHQTDEGVRVVFRDTGKGMDADTKARIFDPFFTTKMNVGTGLGLSTVYGTITRWGGHIDVESVLGQGTLFLLDFVVWEMPVLANSEDDEEKPEGDQGRILIAEDDELVCRVLSRTLSGQHQVDLFKTAQEALNAFVPDHYDVAIIDLGMPGMSGDRLTTKLKLRDPHLATVLVTGWELPDHDPRLEKFDFYLQKPFEDIKTVQETVVRGIELCKTRKNGHAT